MYGKLYYCNSKLIEVNIEDIDGDLEFNKWLASCKEKKGYFLHRIKSENKIENESSCINLCEATYLPFILIGEFKEEMLQDCNYLYLICCDESIKFIEQEHVFKEKSGDIHGIN
ncbi:MAG: hypothetical protein WC656_07980 [Sulfurimonas sp.]|jgi:hypothetical protein